MKFIENSIFKSLKVITLFWFLQQLLNWCGQYSVQEVRRAITEWEDIITNRKLLRD